MLCNTSVCLGVAVVQNNEKEVKPRQDWCTERYVCLESFGTVVPSKDWIRCCQYGSACVERSLNPCFGDIKTPMSDDCLSPNNERAWSSPIYVNYDAEKSEVKP